MRGVVVKAFRQLLFFAFTDAHLHQGRRRAAPEERPFGGRATTENHHRTRTTPITDESWQLRVRRSIGSHGYFYPCRDVMPEHQRPFREAWKRAPLLHCGSM